MTRSRLFVPVVFCALFVAYIISVQILLAQTEDNLYSTIVNTVGIGDAELARELAQAAASAGITASDINNPLPPIPQESAVFTIPDQTNEGISESGDSTANFNFLAISIVVGVIVFLTLLFALSRRFRNEEVRINERKEMYEVNDEETSPFVPSSRNLE